MDYLTQSVSPDAKSEKNVCPGSRWSRILVGAAEWRPLPLDVEVGAGDRVAPTGPPLAGTRDSGCPQGSTLFGKHWVRGQVTSVVEHLPPRQRV